MQEAQTQAPEENAKEIIKAQIIIDQIKEKARTPESMVTPQFGDNWQKHTINQIKEGHMDLETAIRIAWEQGRTAILMENFIKVMVEKHDDLENQFNDLCQIQKKLLLLVAEKPTYRDQVVMEVFPIIAGKEDNKGLTALVIARQCYEQADALMAMKKEWDAKDIKS